MIASDYKTGTIFRHGHKFLKAGDTLQAIVPASETKDELRTIKVLAIGRNEIEGGTTGRKTRIDYEVLG